MKKIRLLLLILCVGFWNIQAQVAIGTVNPDENAMLELYSNNRGFLLPRIPLVALNDSAPLDSHIAGMTVYNTATSGAGENMVSPGFYVNNGSEWIRSGLDATSDARWVNKPNSVVLLNLSDGVTPRPVGTEFVAMDNGHVGIGTNLPKDKLAIKIGTASRGIVLTGPPSFTKNINFDDIGQNGQGEINWRKPTESGPFSASIKSVGEYSYDRKGIGFFTGDSKNTTSNAPEQMRITPDGRVAIRNITQSSYNPSAKLGIQANQSLTGMNVEGLKMSLNFGGGATITHSGALTIQTTGEDKNININSGRATIINANELTNGGIHFKTNDTTRLEVIGTGAGYDGVSIYDENSNVTAKFNKDSKVGIGTATPTETLDVNGVIKFQNGGYTPVSNGSTSPVPAGGAGTMIFSGGFFYGWTGTAWIQLDNL